MASRVSGATVHLVTSELDGGPIVMQAAVPVLDDDTVETLSARILVEEHRIYPEAIQLCSRRRLVCGRPAVCSDALEAALRAPDSTLLTSGFFRARPRRASGYQ